jgi:capsule polysaccharide export protein KpsE/RkpR
MLELLRILMKWRRPLLAFALVAAAVATIWVLAVEPRFYAQASVLPPSEDESFGGLSTLLQQYQIPVPGGVKTPFLPTLYASIVSSRRMGKQILDEFALRPIFKADSDDDALAALRNRTQLKYTDDGLFLVGYEDVDPQRAAAIVNAYVRHLDEIIQQVNAARAGQTRVFVEAQLERCKGDLQAAEEALRDFQRQHQAIQIDAQTEGALGLAAELQGRILAVQVELELLKQRALPRAPEVQQKSRELAALQSQLTSLTAGSPDGVGKGSGDSNGGDEGLFPRFAAVPDLALQYLRLLREMKVQETLYTLLAQQLEQSRVEERKNTGVLSVLDWAEPPSRAVYPRKMLAVGAALVAAALWVGIIAVVVEKLRARRTDPQTAAALAALRSEWNTLPGWIRWLERLLVH